MVNTEIPNHFALSPSAYSGTPQLTINHDATLNLDSSNAFEGTSSPKVTYCDTKLLQGLRSC